MYMRHDWWYIVAVMECLCAGVSRILTGSTGRAHRTSASSSSGSPTSERALLLTSSGERKKIVRVGLFLLAAIFTTTRQCRQAKNSRGVASFNGVALWMWAGIIVANGRQ